MLLFYIRHGDPIYDPDSLTPLGKMQADALKHRFAAHGLDAIYASASTRAQLTAQPTAELLKKQIHPLSWCHESLAYADFSVPLEQGGRTWFFFREEDRRILASESMRQYGKAWYDHPHYAACDYGRKYARIADEADAFLRSLGYRHDRENNGFIAEKPNDARIALFAHEGVGKFILSALLDIPFPEFALRLEMSHSAVSVIEFENREGLVFPRLLQYSSDAHLFASRLPLKHQNRIDL